MYNLEISYNNYKCIRELDWKVNMIWENAFDLSRKDAQPSFIVKALLGMAAGCVGAFVGTPAEVALIRMTADGRLPIGKLFFLHDAIIVHTVYAHI